MNFRKFTLATTFLVVVLFNNGGQVYVDPRELVCRIYSLIWRALKRYLNSWQWWVTENLFNNIFSHKRGWGYHSHSFCNPVSNIVKCRLKLKNENGGRASLSTRVFTKDQGHVLFVLISFNFLIIWNVWIHQRFGYIKGKCDLF